MAPDLIGCLVLKALSQPRGVIEVGELSEAISHRLQSREAPGQEKLIPQRLDDPLRHAVDLRLAHDGGRTLDPEEFDLVLEAIGKVVGTVVVAKDQTGRDALLHRSEVLRHPLPDRLEGFPAAGAGRGMGSD